MIEIAWAEPGDIPGAVAVFLLSLRLGALFVLSPVDEPQWSDADYDF